MIEKRMVMALLTTCGQSRSIFLACSDSKVDPTSRAIVDTLNAQDHQQHENPSAGFTPLPASAYITHMIYLPGCSVLVDVEQIQVSDYSTGKSTCSDIWVYRLWE
jgi:hypothetical protein